jgi:hypothetical protein
VIRSVEILELRSVNMHPSKKEICPCDMINSIDELTARRQSINSTQVLRSVRFLHSAPCVSIDFRKVDHGRLHENSASVDRSAPFSELEIKDERSERFRVRIKKGCFAESEEKDSLLCEPSRRAQEG